MEMARKHSRWPMTLIGSLAMALLLMPLAQASVLGAGSAAPPSPLVPGGTVMAQILSQTITAPTFTATYSTWVYSDPSNVWCIGCLDFVYQFTNNGGAVNERYSMSDFSGFLVDAGTNPFGTHDPITVSRSLTANGPVIAFNFDQFGDEILVGETTVQLVIETNAISFTSGFVSAQDGTAGSGVAFQPLAAVPEPASLALLGGGLTLVGALLRKSRVGK